MTAFTQQDIRANYRYDQETGHFTRLKAAVARRAAEARYHT